MTGLEPAVLAISKSLAVKAGRIWLTSGSSKGDRNKELTDLIKVRFIDNISRRRAKRQIDDIADSVAGRLLFLCQQEFRSMSDGDKQAVIAQVKTTLTESDLSDDALFAADVDPIKLAATLRKRMVRRKSEFEFGSAGAEFYEILVEECCDCLVRIVLQLPQFGARATQDVLARLSTLSANVDVALSRLPVRSLDAPQGTDNDNEFKRRYLEHISSTLDYSELFGINFERYRPLTTLTVSYISLSVSRGSGSRGIRQRRSADLDLWVGSRREEQVSREAATIRVETALSESGKIMIRGEAGSGKTTLLRWLAVTAARGGFKAELEKWNGNIPFLVKLRSHAESGLPAPEEFLTGIADPIRGLMPLGWVHRQMSSGNVLLLVDGVDELSGTQRRAVRPWLANLLAAYPRIHIVVTSRPSAASADWLAAEGFNAAFLERMSPADIRSLIRHWHLAARDAGGLPCEPDELPLYESSLLARLEIAPHLRALAGTPLLAAMLCALNLDRVRQLPRDRMSLYEAALDMLLNRRDVERGIPSYQDLALETAQKLQILQGLAWRLSTTNRSELPKATVIQCVGNTIATMPRSDGLETEGVVNYLLHRSGVLREPVRDRIDFVHRTIQEYLTAKQLADEGDMDLVIRSAHKPQWHDTVIMTAGHANFPLRQELITGLLDRIQREPANARILKLLVAACLETLSSLPDNLTRAIDHCIDDLVPPRDLRAARSLATVGEPVLARFPHEIDSLTPGAACATVRAAALINGPAALETLRRYRNDPRGVVQQELMGCWHYFEPQEYASKILADAPLINGTVVVDDLYFIQALKFLKKLVQVEVRINELSDLSLLNDVPNLTRISIPFFLGDNIEPLTVHSNTLTHLTLMDRATILDFSPLLSLGKMQVLHLGSGNVSDLRFLRSMPDLMSLALGLRVMKDYSPLKELRNLKQLQLDGFGSSFPSIDSLPISEKTNVLGLSRLNAVDGLDWIVRKAPNIKTLTLDFCPWVSDISSIAQLKHLQVLRLWGCQNVRDVTPLTSLKELRLLDLDGTSVADISCLNQFKNLRTLWLTDCGEIADLSPLAGCEKLVDLYIQGIASHADLSPLRNSNVLEIHIYSTQDVRGGDLFGRRLVRE